MSNFKQCDRCGKTAEVFADMEAPFGWLAIHDDDGSALYDLCGECSVHFNFWLHNAFKYDEGKVDDE